MRETMKDLWYGNVNPCEKCGGSDPELRQLLSLVEQNRAALACGLEKSQREVLEKMIANYDKYWCLLEEQAFCDGFCLASRLMAEVLSADA